MTDANNARPVPPLFKDLMAPVGSFLLYWSMLELELGEDIARRRNALGEAPAKVRGNLAARLDIWIELVRRSSIAEEIATAHSVVMVADRLRSHRNLIVHGLRQGRADEPDYVPYILCRMGGYEDPSGKEQRYGLDELEALTQAIDRCRRAFMRLDYWGNAPAYPTTGV